MLARDATPPAKVGTVLARDGDPAEGNGSVLALGAGYRAPGSIQTSCR